MIGSSLSDRQLTTIERKKKVVILDALEEQKYNIEVFKMAESYSMEDEDA